MDQVTCSKTHWSAQNGCACQLQFACFEDNRLVQRLVLLTITFAEKNPQENRVFWNLHACFYFCNSERARMRPSHTATRQHATESTVLSAAFNQSPSRTDRAFAGRRTKRWCSRRKLRS